MVRRLIGWMLQWFLDGRDGAVEDPNAPGAAARKYQMNYDGTYSIRDGWSERPPR